MLFIYRSNDIYQKCVILWHSSVKISSKNFGRWSNCLHTSLINIIVGRTFSTTNYTHKLIHTWGIGLSSCTSNSCLHLLLLLSFQMALIAYMYEHLRYAYGCYRLSYFNCNWYLRSDKVISNGTVCLFESCVQWTLQAVSIHPYPWIHAVSPREGEIPTMRLCIKIHSMLIA